jgi:hypothetical protein
MQLGIMVCFVFNSLDYNFRCIEFVGYNLTVSHGCHVYTCEQTVFFVLQTLCNKNVFVQLHLSGCTASRPT